MPRASVGVGPMRVGSGCCVALVAPALIVIMGLFILFGGTAFAAKQYVLKHPKHERCKPRYVKKTKTIKRHRETLCVYVTPSRPDPAPVVPAPATPTPVATPAPETPALIATTTSLTATEKSCHYDQYIEQETCEYEISYKTINNKGEAVPGEIILKERVPPSPEERKVAILSNTTVGTEWFINDSHECRIWFKIDGKGQNDYECEKATPRIILVAEYVPASGYLASKSEPVTLQ
jgi:hypothetical protein